MKIDVNWDTIIDSEKMSDCSCQNKNMPYRMMIIQFLPQIKNHSDGIHYPSENNVRKNKGGHICYQRIDDKNSHPSEREIEEHFKKNIFSGEKYFQKTSPSDDTPHGAKKDYGSSGSGKFDDEGRVASAYHNKNADVIPYPENPFGGFVLHTVINGGYDVNHQHGKSENRNTPKRRNRTLVERVKNQEGNCND